MSDLIQKRRARGEVSNSDIAEFSPLNNEELLELLHSPDPVRRSCAAHLLQKHPTVRVSRDLCHRLTLEKSLYTKIEICNSLAAMGEYSVPLLIEVLGKIGTNQEKELQKTGFYKKSYPLPRDIAARTLSQCGLVALPALEHFIQSSEDTQALSEALDAYGHIIHTEKSVQSSASLQALAAKYPKNDLLIYKIARCLSIIKSDWATSFLLETLQSDNIALRLQSLRSLLLCKMSIPQALKDSFTAEMKKLEAALK